MRFLPWHRPKWIKRIKLEATNLDWLENEVVTLQRDEGYKVVRSVYLNWRLRYKCILEKR